MEVVVDIEGRLGRGADPVPGVESMTRLRQAGPGPRGPIMAFTPTCPTTGAAHCGGQRELLVDVTLCCRCGQRVR